MDFDRFLHADGGKGASDLFITTGVPPSMKINGAHDAVTKDSLTPEQCGPWCWGCERRAAARNSQQKRECNFAISARGIGRFRVSAFYQRNLVGMVLRRIEVNIPPSSSCACRRSSRSWP